MANNTEKRITAKMVLDSTGFNSSLKGVNSSLKNAQSEMKLASQGIKSFGADSEKLKSVQESLSKQVELHAKKVDIYRQSMEKAKTKMQDNIRERDRLKTSLDQANRKYDEAVRLYGRESEQAKKAKEDVDRLKQEHEKASKAVETNAKQVQNYERNMNNAQTAMVRTQGELRRVNEELARSNNKWLNASESLKKSSERLKDIGGKVNSAGNSILKLTAPLAATGIAALKTGMDFESAMSNVQAISGVTGKDFDNLAGKARELGSKTSKSAKEAADAMSYQALAGWNVNQIMEATEPILRLSEAGNMDLARASDLVTDSMSALGIQTKDLTKYLDICAQAQRKSNTTADMMLEAYIGCGGTLKNLKVPLEESATLIGVLANRGIKGSEAGTSLNSVLINLTSGAGQAGEAMGKLKLSAFDSKGNFKGVSVVLKELNEKLKGCTEEQKNTYLAMIGGKTQIDTLNALLAGTSEEFDTLQGDIKGSKGALNEMAETMQNNTKGEITKLKSALEEVGIQLAQHMLPVAKDFVKTLQKWTDWFGKLDDSTKKNIVKMTAMGIATGGALKVVGGGISTVGSLVGGLGKLAGLLGKVTTATTAVGTTASVAGGATGLGALTGGLGALSSVALPAVGIIAAVGGSMYVAHRNTKYLNESCNKSVEELGTLDKVLALANGGLLHTNEQLEAMNMKHKAWSDKVSPETQKSLEQCANKIADYSLELKNAEKVDNLVDGETGKRLKTKLDSICNSAIEKVKSRSPEIQKKMAEAFKADDGVLDKNEKKLLEFFNRSGDEQIKKINEIKGKILELEKKASKQQGDEKRKTLQEIDKLTQEIGNIELKNTVKSKEELMASQAEFNARMKNLDMNQLTDLMKEKAKIRDTEIEKTRLHYDKQIEMLKLSKSNMNEEEKKAADAEIKQLEEKKKQAIGKENEKYKGYLDAALEKYPGLLAFIDTKNGELLTNQEQAKQKELLQYGDKMENMLGITKTGYYKIKDKVTGEMHDCYVNVDSTTGQITGVWDNTTRKVYGNPIKAREAIDKDLKNGQKFKPIGDSWDKEKQRVAKNSVEITCKKDWNLFDWVKDAWNSARNWLFGNPAEVRSSGAGHNWTGTNYWRGGLTYLHDAPGKNSRYELYDLPRGTRIYNHDASEELVKQTAENVATKVAEGMLSNTSTSSSDSPIIIKNMNVRNDNDIKLIARELYNLQESKRRGKGLSLGGI